MSDARPYTARSTSSNAESVTSAAVKEPDAAAGLAVSRSRLRDALFHISHPPKQPPIWSEGIGGAGNQLLERMRGLPGASAIAEGMRAWWQKSSLRQAAELAVPASAPLVASAARRDPRALLLTSATVGALLWIAPWRRLGCQLLRPALLSGLAFEVVKAGLRAPGGKPSNSINS